MIRVILDPSRMQFRRHPRTKKRRIIQKWRARKENWGPLMVPWGYSLLLGADAMSRALPAKPEDQIYTKTIGMTPALWEKVKRLHPGIEKRCHLFTPDWERIA